MFFHNEIQMIGSIASIENTLSWFKNNRWKVDHSTPLGKAFKASVRLTVVRMICRMAWGRLGTM